MGVRCIPAGPQSPGFGRAWGNTRRRETAGFPKEDVMGTERGKISYYLRENPFSSTEENRYVARADRTMTLYQKDIIDLMMDKSTTISRQEIVFVLDLLKEIVKKQVLNGYPVIMDMFKASIGIKGGFRSAADEFDGRRHRVALNLNATGEFRKDLAHEARVEKIRQKKDRAVVDQIFDYATRSWGTAFPAGGLIELQGANLKPGGDDPKVYLRREGTEDLIPVEAIHKASDRKILCSLPSELEAGDYGILAVLGEEDEGGRVKYKKTVTIG